MRAHFPILVFLSLFPITLVAQEEPPETAMGPVETFVLLRVRIAQGSDPAAYWDFLSPDTQRSFAKKRKDKGFVDKLIEGGITEQEIESSTDRELAGLINEKIVRLMDDPANLHPIRSIEWNRIKTSPNIAHINIDFDEGGVGAMLEYFEEVKEWRLPGDVFERLSASRK